MTIRTTHGSFRFFRQRMAASQGEPIEFTLVGLDQDGCNMSTALREFCVYYGTKMSFGNVSKLVERVTGEPLASDQKVWQLAQAEADKICDEKRKWVDSRKKQMPGIGVDVDLYDPDEKEVLIFMDGIQTTRQKPKRQRQTGPVRAPLTENPGDHCDETSTVAKRQRGSKATRSGRISTDVAILECNNGEYHFITDCVDSSGNQIVSLEELTRAQIADQYGAAPSQSEPSTVKFVAITDGAQDIRIKLMVIFGYVIAIILDWYHLRKRMHDKMSMVARTKKEKEERLAHLLPLLWSGKVTQAIDYLNAITNCKNAAVRDEMVAYLEKHKAEIIDYQKRKNAGKTIGSGRMEKAVGQVVGHRQKRKGMSWSDNGTKTLAMLQTQILNEEWSYPFALAA